MSTAEGCARDSDTDRVAPAVPLGASVGGAAVDREAIERFTSAMADTMRTSKPSGASERA